MAVLILAAAPEIKMITKAEARELQASMEPTLRTKKQVSKHIERMAKCNFINTSFLVSGKIADQVFEQLQKNGFRVFYGKSSDGILIEVEW